MLKIPAGVGPKLPQIVVLFGATGDLSQRKLLPGLFHLVAAGFIPRCRIIGVSLEDIDAEAFRDFAHQAVDRHEKKPSDGAWPAFAGALDYVPIAAGPAGLKRAVEHAAEAFDGQYRLVHYLSVPPGAALSAVKMLADADLAKGSCIIMEKPFGTDLDSAIVLNAKLHAVFSEDQIFRIDHFLGKEPAQNILSFRFANGLFEPIWNRNFIDHVQIDVPETLDLGSRIAFYEQTGAYRDMVVTHLFQILAFTAMEPPTSLAPGPIGEEKNKVFRSLEPVEPSNVVRGQFIGYRKEKGVDPESDTETFIALKCRIDNWRWAGVPFYLRTGKRMAEGQRIISIAFREPPRSMFPEEFRHRLAGSRPPHFRPRRPVESVLVLLRQEAGAGHAARQAEPAVRHARNRARRRRARGLRAADPRRHARRPHAVLLRRGHRTVVGNLRLAPGQPAAGPDLRARDLGPAIDLSARGAPRLAPTVRARLAGPQSPRRLKPFPLICDAC